MSVPPARARIEIVTAEQMPDARTAVCVESEGDWVLCVREGEMTPRCRDDVNKLLGHITREGLWLQQWPDDRRAEPCHREAV